MAVRIRSENDTAAIGGAIVELGGRVPEKVTAIISCMTDEERPYIRAALESVANQTMPCAARVYVADTNDWIANLTEGLEWIVVRPVPMMPVTVVRNIGVRELSSTSLRSKSRALQSSKLRRPV